MTQQKWIIYNWSGRTWSAASVSTTVLHRIWKKTKTFVSLSSRMDPKKYKAALRRVRLGDASSLFVLGLNLNEKKKENRKVWNVKREKERERNRNFGTRWRGQSRKGRGSFILIEAGTWEWKSWGRDMKKLINCGIKRRNKVFRWNNQRKSLGRW